MYIIEKEDLNSLYKNSIVLDYYDKTQNSFYLVKKAQDKVSNLSKVIWYYKKKQVDILKKETIENTKEAYRMTTQITRLETGTYKAYAGVYNNDGVKATTNELTITSE